jgi:hypothetical protein
MKTAELNGTALDWAVAKCEGIELENGFYNRLLVNGRMSKGQSMLVPFTPSADWAQGGAIIERERIAMFVEYPNDWCATDGNRRMAGETPLIAAMRCYVASKLGDEVEMPDALMSHA